MRCADCSGDSTPGSRFCVHCGAALPARDPADRRVETGGAQRQQRLIALEEEVTGLEFALQELDLTLQEAAPDSEDRALVHSRLLDRLDERRLELMRLYSSLPSPEATARLNGFLERHPASTHAHLELARVHQRTGNHAAAIDQYVLAAILDPESPEPHLRLAEVYERMDRKPEALYEYRTFLALVPDPSRRRAAESRAASLERELFPALEGTEERAIGETPRRLDYLVSTLQELETDPDLGSRTLQQLAGHYTRRLETLAAPPLAAQAARPVAAPPPAAPPAPPEEPPAPPPVPREPFDWAAFWSRVFSERTLTAVLGLGVLLVAVSSVALLASQWNVYTYPVKQTFVLVQFLVFLAAGHMFKERLKLHLSGLALICIAALWIPLNVGTGVFEVVEVEDPHFAPGFRIALNLRVWGWLIMAAVPVPLWALLTVRYRGQLLAYGTITAAVATVVLGLRALGIDWEWAGAAAAVFATPLLLIWHRLRQTSLKDIAEPFFRAAQATLLITAGVLLGVWLSGAGEAGTYPLSLLGVAGTILYILANRFSPKLVYQYVFAALPVVALLWGLAEGSGLPLRYYDALLLGVSAVYLVIGRALQHRYPSGLLAVSRWPALQPAFIVGYLSLLSALMWPDIDQVSRLAVLYGAAGIALVSARWSDRPLWTGLAAVLLIPAVLLTLNQVAAAYQGYWSVALGGLAAIFLAAAIALRRAPAHAVPLLASAVALSAASPIWAAATGDLAVLSLALPVAIAVHAALAALALAGRDDALTRLLSYVPRRFTGGAGAAPTVTRWGAVLFMTLAVAVAPLWTTALTAWASVPGQWAGVDLLGLAALCYLIGYWLMRRAGWLHAAVIFGLGTLLLLAAPTYNAAAAEPSWVLAGILYAAVALLALAAHNLRLRWLRYAAAALFVLPLGLTFALAGLSPLFWGTPFMVLAAAYMGLGILAAGRRRVAAAADVLQHIGFGLSLVALGWTVGWILTRWADPIPDTASLGERLFMSIGPFLGAAAYAIAARRRGDSRFGHLAAWVMAAALGIVLDIFPLSADESAVAVALGAVAYVSGGAALRARSQARGATNAAARQDAILSRPLLVAGYGIAAISLGMATFELVAAREATWAFYAAWLVNAALLAGSAYRFRIPAFVAGAATLFLMPFTLFVYELFGQSSDLLAVPGAALAFGWAGLALAYLAAGMATERAAPRYAPSLPVLAYLLLIGAVVAALGSAERQSVVFGVIVLIAGVSALLTHRRLTSAFVDLLSKALTISPEAARRHAVLAFVSVAGLLTPLWSLEILALFTREVSTQGLVLALEAPAFVLVGTLLVRRALNLYSWPVYFAAFGMTVVAPVLTLSSQPVSVAALAVGSGTYALSTFIFRRSVWSHVCLYIAAGLLALTAARVLNGFDLSREAYGLGLMAVALAYLVTAIAADRWIRGIRLPTPAYLRFRLPATPAMPLYLTGALLTIPAAVLAIPATSGAWPVSIGAYSAGAVFYGLAAAGFRAPVFLYPAVGLAIACYSLGIAMLSLDSKYIGLAMLPGALASLAAGWSLHRWTGRPGTPASTRSVATYTCPGSGTAWAMPLLLAGYASSLAAVPVTLVLADQSLLLVALLAATGIYAASLGIFRASAWLYPLLLAAHLAFAAFLTLPALDLSLPVVGVAFLPAAAIMAIFLGVASRRSGHDGITSLLAPWALPFAVFGLADVAASVVLAAGADWAGLTVTASYAVLTAAAAHATGIRLLPYACTAFITGTVIFVSRMLSLGWGDAAVVWAVQGLLMWWGGQAAGASARLGKLSEDTRTRLQIWQAPLRNAGLRLSWFALAFVVALAFLGIIVPDRFGETQVEEISAVLAFLGLLYLGMAFVARRAWLGYLAVALLLASWTMQMIDLEIPHVQAYAIPAGLYLIGIAFFERRRSPTRLPVLIEGAAVLLLVVSSFWQSIAEDPGWPYAILLAAESLLLILWGTANRTRLALAGGIAAFSVNLAYQAAGLLANLQGQLIGLIVGLLIVALIAGIEWRRQRLIQLGREWRGRLEQWSW